MDAEEVDLRAFQRLIPNAQIYWNSRYKGQQFAGCCGGGSDAHMPFLRPAGGFQGPIKERRRVFEAEHGFSVFDIILCQQLVDFLKLLLVIEVHCHPFESG